MATAELADGTIVVGVTQEQIDSWNAGGIVFTLTDDDGNVTIENFESPRIPSVEPPEE